MDALQALRERYLPQIRYPHIRERIEQLWFSPRAVADYLDQLLLDTRDGQRRGFDAATAELLLRFHMELLQCLGSSQVGSPLSTDGEFRGSALNTGSVKLPKGW
ncbi:hypothetical protein Talka_00684 [Tepidimonas alkaliphilus]|uniref:Uncharacterized protein n=1 Tax=Tepidimonas alkaliphilus TaxID=2588942 RepID=A0A554WBR1_9BURK|nr:hypothetical protein [Tepidimonas alkaliphilus]TSE21020.1 hypothetical protein Talka_00684 [Tepidimonas alkaliphilus]